MMTRTILLLCVALGLGCGGAAEAGPTTPVGIESPTSGYEIEAFFPLVDGNVFAYQTTTEHGDTSERGRMTLKVERKTKERGALIPSAGHSRYFEYVPDGVRIDGVENAYLLKLPLTVGATWRGERGTTTVQASSVTAVAPGGTFSGCVQTLEQRGGDRPLRVLTTFCPGKGIVILEATGGGQYEKAELLSSGPPVSIGEDGVRRIE
jgi:hypothetical protein